MEERDDERAQEATGSDAVAARTRALVEESRALLRRLERLLGRDDGHADDGDADGGDAGGDEGAERDDPAEDAVDHES